MEKQVKSKQRGADHGEVFTANNQTLWKLLQWLLLIIVVAIILYGTILSRSPKADYSYNLNLFWSYKAWFHGNISVGDQIIRNILMFIPFGFLFSVCIDDGVKKVGKVFGLAVLVSFVFSVGIELCQLIFRLGFCELDDVINNTLGGAIGSGVYLLVRKIKAYIFEKRDRK